MLICAAPRRSNTSPQNSTALPDCSQGRTLRADKTKQTEAGQRGVGIRGWICSSASGTRRPAACHGRAVCSQSTAAHVMRLLVTAVISRRRFVGEASRGHSRGVDSLGIQWPLRAVVTHISHVNRQRCRSKSRSRAACSCHLCLLSRRRRHDGIAGRCPDLYLLCSIPVVIPTHITLALAFEGSLHAHESILCNAAHKHGRYPTQYALIVLGTPSASPDREQSAYRPATQRRFR